MTTTNVTVTQADAKHEYELPSTTKVCGLGAALNANANFEELFSLEGMDMAMPELVLATGARVLLTDMIEHVTTVDGGGEEVTACACCDLSQLGTVTLALPAVSQTVSLKVTDSSMADKAVLLIKQDGTVAEFLSQLQLLVPAGGQPTPLTLTLSPLAAVPPLMLAFSPLQAFTRTSSC